MSPSELASLPTSGAAWTRLLTKANMSITAPLISNQDDDSDVLAFAKALVFARTRDETYRGAVRTAIGLAVGTEAGGRTLALGRNLAGWVLAANLIDLPTYDAAFDTGVFRPWLRTTLTEVLDTKTLQSTHEQRPNNWGTEAGASRIAVAEYLGDEAELARSALVFRGWLGERSVYA
ncbi:MAG TPA: hypothetical protein VN839_06750 [Patescibacteria group bacterium]|nr:hypothetical protein [Patescibacteria group bacterium]